MKTSTLSALVVVTSLAAASGALAQDAAAGKTSFNKCLACHAIGEGAKNKVGPVLNGLDGRKSGTVEGYSYSDANKNSGITWNKDVFLEYIKDPEGEDSRHQDGVRRHQERERGQRSLGVPRAVRQGRQDQVRVAFSGSARTSAEPRPHRMSRTHSLQASVCTITGPAIAVAGPVNSGARSCSIHASARLLDSSAAANC